MTDFFSSKRPGERVLVTFDFSKAMASAETVSSSTWSILAIEGTDPNIGIMLYGNSTISGKKVSHLIQSGVEPTLYEVECAITTSINQVLEGTGLIKVHDVR